MGPQNVFVVFSIMLLLNSPNGQSTDECDVIVLINSKNMFDSYYQLNNIYCTSQRLNI